MSAALVVGLSEWFSADPRQPHLRELLDRLDPDPSRAEIRTAIQAGDAGRVRALVETLDGSTVPAWFAVSVGYHPMVPAEAAVQLMAAAWRSHPADYLLAYRIARRLDGLGDDRLGEMLAWARVAVALRPDNPFAHVLLGDVWKQLHNGAEAESALRRAIQLGGKYPKYVGAYFNLGNVLCDKGDLDGAEASYRTAIAIDPSLVEPHYNLGLLIMKRGDLVGAEECLRKAVALEPRDAGLLDVLNQIVRKRVRMGEFVAGRAEPASPEEEVEFAELAYRSPQRHCRLAVRFYSHALAAQSALAEDLVKEHRYNAACSAALAAAGKDETMNGRGVEERSYLTGLALKWLRADLAQRVSLASDPKKGQEVRERLSRWKKAPELATVRDPAWLGAMPPADRKAWAALWRDVEALLASNAPPARTPPAGP
ncbi:MAG: tetratricopeptide repeat protein [Isosphaeraceae bacterium]